MTTSLDPQDRMRSISSRQNAAIKEIRRAFLRHELTEDGYCAIESMRIVEEAIRSGLRLRTVVLSESGVEKLGERLLPQLNSKVEVLRVPDEVLAGTVDTESPQGVAALVRLRDFNLTDMLRRPDPLFAVTVGLQDPGNLGTIARSAEAFCATGLLLGEGTVSRYNPKAIRAAAGAFFRFPCVTVPTDQIIKDLRAKGVRLLGTSSHKGEPLDRIHLSSPCAIFIGNEGRGLPAKLLAEMDGLITIPQSEQVESLNAGVSASIILYEAARQRRTRA